MSLEFNQCFSSFASKSYDVLDPDDESFKEDFMKFQDRILELDMKLAAILCQAFDDSHNLESVFKLISIVGTVLERPKIKEEFTYKYQQILVMLDNEMWVQYNLELSWLNFISDQLVREFTTNRYRTIAPKAFSTLSYDLHQSRRLFVGFTNCRRESQRQLIVFGLCNIPLLIPKMLKCFFCATVISSSDWRSSKRTFSRSGRKKFRLKSKRIWKKLCCWGKKTRK